MSKHRCGWKACDILDLDLSPALEGSSGSTPQYFQRHLSFTAADPLGWQVLYGVAVRAGANPLDPREWAGWNATSFFPVLVLPISP